MREGILVVDVGTSKVHTNLIDISNGSLIETRSSSYNWVHPQEGWSEIDPDSIWRAAENCVSEIVSEIENKASIKALAFSFIGDSLLAVDKDNNPLGNLILAFDSRAKDEAQELNDRFGDSNFKSITGNSIMAEICPSKILWLRKNAPDLFKKTASFLSIQQYINIKLGLGDVTDCTLACRKVLFDVRKKEWSEPLCEFLQITPDMLGEVVVEADKIIGSISKFGDIQFGHEIPVILGSHDSESGMIGLGCIPGSDKVLGNIAGTYDHLGYLVKQYRDYPEDYFTSYLGPVENSFVLMGVSIAGPNLDWYINTFHEDEGLAAINRLFARYEFDGSNKVMLTNGIQTGNGCIRGIHFGATQESIFKAIVEGVTYPLKRTMNQLQKYNGKQFESLRIGGGGAKSDQWSQLKADMFDIAIEKVENIEISSMGAAIMAAVSLGIYSDLSSAMQNLINVQTTFEPRTDITARYEERYSEYLGQ